MVTKLRTRVFEAVARFAYPDLAREVRAIRLENGYLHESMTRLQLDIENEGWYQITSKGSELQFDSNRLRELVRLCVMMAIKNPITCRSVSVQADYVFGQGVRFVAKNKDVQAVVDEFCDYYHNRRVLTSHSSMLRREKELQAVGNLFLSLYTNKQSGRVQVRCIDLSEVDDIIRDPDDYEREVYFKRTYWDGEVQQVIYHPAFGVYKETSYAMPWNLDPKENHPEGQILWDVPVYHVAFNRWGKEKFAIPEIFPQIDWAMRYKKVLEDWTSILASFARLAFKITGATSSAQAAAMRSQLNTSVTTSEPRETNPAAVAGATGIFGRNVNIEPIKTAGATTPASEFGPVLNMAAAAHGLPNTFYGDASVGNYATAKTLDRPTELKMLSRQKLWKEVFDDIIGYVKLQSAKAPDGLLNKAGVTAKEVEDLFTGEQTWVAVGDADTDLTTETHFPDILERNVTDRVRALCNAFTLFGKPLTDIIPDKKLVARLLLEALNVPDIEQWIPIFIEMWEKNLGVKDGKPVAADIIPPAPPPNAGGSGAEDPSQGGDVGANG